MCVCVFACFYTCSVYSTCLLMCVLGGYSVVVHAYASCMCMFVCVYIVEVTELTLQRVNLNYS